MRAKAAFMKNACALLLFFALAAPAYAATPAPQAQQQQASVAVTGWRLECDPMKSSLLCHARDQILQSGSGALIIGFDLTPAPDGKTNLTVNVPLGTSVRTPVVVSIGGPSQNFSFLTCSQQGCFATGVINGDLLAAMRAGKGDMKVTYAILDNNLGEHAVTASLSLAGFSEVYDRLK